MATPIRASPKRRISTDAYISLDGMRHYQVRVHIEPDCWRFSGKLPDELIPEDDECDLDEESAR